MQPYQGHESTIDNEGNWDQMRGFLNNASNFRYHVPEDVAKRIVSDFSSKSNGRQLNGQDLIRRLETAR